MEQKQKNMRTLLLFVLATLAVIVLIAVFFVGNFQQNQRDTIVLPDAAQSVQQSAQQSVSQQPDVLTVDRSNVQQIVRYLQRPQHYHQTYTITRQLGSVSAQTTAELWVSENRLHARVQTDAGEKHLLTDGETIYLWYASDKKVRSLSASDAITMDELIGLPTYEQLDTLSASSITEGSFIADSDYGQQIYAAAEQQGASREYWISLESGLLREGTLQRDGQTVYHALQTGLELLAAGDEALDRVFLLPDGSAPFA